MGKTLGRDDVRTLVLHVLTREPAHGYAIARAVERDSADALQLGEGTLYPVLRALEQDQAVTSEWHTADSGPDRKVYRITAVGRAEHAHRLQTWRSRINAMNAILGIDGLGHGGLKNA